MSGTAALIGLVTLMAPTQVQQLANEPVPPVAPLPSPRQLAWQDMEFTGFIHFGPNTFTDREWGHGDEPEDVFNPTALDAAQWVRAMKDAGMKGVVITAKHHDGFCLWPTKFSDHSVRSSPWRAGQGDVLRELSTACAEAGLKFGVYLSPWDRNSPLYGTGEAYNECFRNQLREVLTQYGPVHEVWFDGACGEGANGKRQVYDFPSFWGVVRELQPDAVIFSDIGPDIRWVGNESGWAGETCWAMLKVAGHGIGADNPPSPTSLNEGDLDGESWIPAECDVSIRPGWFYHAEQDNAVKTPQQLFDLYERSVGHNANFHLNLPVDRRGLVHENDCAALRGLRTILDNTYGAGTSIVSGWQPLADGSFIATLDSAKPFDRLVLAEPIEQGQRVKSFRLSVRQADGSWRTIGEGTTIGHKRIVPVPLTNAAAVRLEILDSRATPLISHMGAHRSRAAEAAPDQQGTSPD